MPPFNVVNASSFEIRYIAEYFTIQNKISLPNDRMHIFYSASVR